MACFIAAFVTSLSRISDYHHRYTDVLGGTILGCLVALFITLQTGKVLFKYNQVKSHYEIDMKKEYDLKNEVKYKRPDYF